MKILKGVLIALTTLFVGFGSCVGYVGYRAQRAKSMVDDFCESVRVGQASPGLAERAKASGLDVREIPNPPGEASPAGATLLCMQGVFLARHVCTVRTSAGKVVSAERGFVD